MRLAPPLPTQQVSPIQRPWSQPCAWLGNLSRSTRHQLASFAPLSTRGVTAVWRRGLRKQCFHTSCAFTQVVSASFSGKFKQPFRYTSSISAAACPCLSVNLTAPLLSFCSTPEVLLPKVKCATRARRSTSVGCACGRALQRQEGAPRLPLTFPKLHMTAGPRENVLPRRHKRDRVQTQRIN